MRCLSHIHGFLQAPHTSQNAILRGQVLFLADARQVATTEGFEDTVFADDLNLFRAFPASTGNHLVTAALHTCQHSLHSWRADNQIFFDASKESFHVLHRRRPVGEDFRILGVFWDPKLTMLAECLEVAQRGG